jgi:hypothetical protein
MRQLRLFLLATIVSITVAGCRHQAVQAPPPPQQQAPIVTTLPPIPPLTFPDVQLAKPTPAPAPVPVEAAPPPVKPKTKHLHRRHHHTPASPEEPTTKTPADASSATAVLGNLSADDSNGNPSQSQRTDRLIRSCEERLKHLSRTQQARNAQAIEQIRSYLAQAQQAMSTNDTAGGETLAMKAKILLDEMHE